MCICMVDKSVCTRTQHRKVGLNYPHPQFAKSFADSDRMRIGCGLDADGMRIECGREANWRRI